MDTKKLLTVLSIFAGLFLSLGVVSGDFSVSTNSVIFDGSSNSAEITITNQNASELLNASINPSVTITGENGYTATFNSNETSINNINSTIPVRFKINAPSIDFSKFKLGNTYSGNLEVTNSNNLADKKIISVKIESSFCKAGTQGNLELRNVNLDNLGEGKDEEWQPLDEISIEVEVRNIGDERVDDVTLDIMILDKDGKDVTDDFNVKDDTIDLGNIKSGDRKTGTFEISELPADVEEGTYRIYIKAYEDGNESGNCIDTASDFNQDNYYEIEVKKENDNAIVIKDYPLILKVNSGDSVEISFTLYNIGTRDEEDVLVVLKNTELGIDKREHFRNLDIGDKEEVTFLITVPNTATTKRYTLNAYTFFDYDSGDVLESGSYDENSLDDLDVTYSIVLDVVAPAVPLTPTITATLLSSAKQNEDLVVQVSVTNPGNEASFAIIPAGYETWASLVSVNPQILSINKGEAKQATITLKPTKSGSQMFTIQTISNGVTTEQAVSVSIEAAPTGFLTGAFSGFGSNVLTYLIAGIILLLIIIVIVLIVKLAGSSRKEEY